MSACASRQPEIAEHTSAAVIGGDADLAHESVVSITTTLDAARPELCTGVVVAPRVVLTAAHCAIAHAAGELIVGVGASAASPARTLSVLRVHAYPDFNYLDDDFRHGRDIAALELTADAGVASIAFAGASSDRPGAGHRLRVVGFGATSEADAETRGTRDIASVIVASTCDRLITFGDATARSCHGDSGGPLLADVRGVETVVGIVSFGGKSGDDCAPPSFAVLVAPYAAWLQSIVDGNADDGCARACPARSADCTTTDAGASDATDATDAEPEPSSLRVVAGGGCSQSRSAGGGKAVGASLILLVIASVSRRKERPRSRAAPSRG